MAGRRKAKLNPIDIVVRIIDTIFSETKSRTKALSKIHSSEYLKQHPSLTNFVLKYRDLSNFPEFCKRYLKIRTKDAVIKPFVFNRMQKVLWENTIYPKIKNNKPVRVDILKARQVGATTISEALNYTLCSLYCNINSILIAHSKSKASEIFNMAKLFHNTAGNRKLSEHGTVIAPTKKLSNRHELFFSNPNKSESDGTEYLGLNSLISVDTADNVHLGASSTLQYVHMSEFARWEQVNKDIKTSLVSLYQTVPFLPLTFIIREYTAFGTGLGKRTWDDKNDGYDKVFVPWFADDDYRSEYKLDPKRIENSNSGRYGNEELERKHIIEGLHYWYPDKNKDWYKAESLNRLAWRRLTIDRNLEGDYEQFNQEYPTTPEKAFIHSGRSAFNKPILMVQRKDAESKNSVNMSFIPNGEDNGKFVKDHNGSLTIYKKPKYGEEYYMGCDVGAGVQGGDYSILDIYDTNKEQCAIFSEIIEPHALAFRASILAKIYNNCRIVPESNSYGLAFISYLTGVYKYRKVYMRRQFDSVKQSIMEKYGFYTSGKTKRVLIETLRAHVSSNQIKFNSIDTIDELLGYIVTEKDTYDTVEDHDDRVIAAALSLIGMKDKYTNFEDTHPDKFRPGTIGYILQQSRRTNQEPRFQDINPNWLRGN